MKIQNKSSLVSSGQTPRVVISPMGGGRRTEANGCRGTLPIDKPRDVR